MPRTCTICRRQDRLKIDIALVLEHSLQFISERFEVSEDALLLHQKSEHLSSEALVLVKRRKKGLEATASLQENPEATRLTIRSLLAKLGKRWEPLGEFLFHYTQDIPYQFASCSEARLAREFFVRSKRNHGRVVEELKRRKKAEHSWRESDPVISANEEASCIEANSPRQSKAILMLAAGRTISEVSAGLGVPVLMIQKWQQQPEFEARVNTECRDMLAELRDEMVAGQIVAHALLRDVITNEGTPRREREAAAKSLLGLGRKVVSVVNQKPGENHDNAKDKSS